MNIQLKCSCGAFRGIASDIKKSQCLRIVCYCDDCQAYVHFLGRGNDVLDANGGTDIVPIVPSKLEITKGKENLKCLRLMEKGLYRWYAGCCKTPIGNSPAPKIPYVGVISTIMDHAADNVTHEEAVGPVRGGVHGKFAVGNLPENRRKPPAGVIIKVLQFIAVAWLRRQHSPSPFFDNSGKPVVVPYVLSPTEREGLRNK